MKIIKLQAENIKKLRAIEISPDGPVVKITGKNAAGKSTVLDSISWALGIQARFARSPEQRPTDRRANWYADPRLDGTARSTGGQ